MGGPIHLAYLQQNSERICLKQIPILLFFNMDFNKNLGWSFRSGFWDLSNIVHPKIAFNGKSFCCFHPSVKHEFNPSLSHS
jgi:hypothetical protein